MCGLCRSSIALFFSYSEFQLMVASVMNLSKGRNRATYLQFSHIRSAICSTVPGRFAHPRRLSDCFLKSQLEEFMIYRADTRRAYRGRDFIQACNPVTLAPLPPHWRSQYSCPPPKNCQHILRYSFGLSEMYSKIVILRRELCFSLILEKRLFKPRYHSRIAHIRPTGSNHGRWLSRVVQPETMKKRNCIDAYHFNFFQG